METLQREILVGGQGTGVSWQKENNLKTAVMRTEPQICKSFFVFDKHALTCVTL